MYTTIYHNGQAVALYNHYMEIPRNNNHRIPVTAIITKDSNCYAPSSCCCTCTFNSRSTRCKDSLTAARNTAKHTHPELFI